MIEIWRRTVGFEGYEVSNHYHVRGVARVVIRRNGRPYRIKARVLTPKVHRPSGLESVALSDAGRQYTAYVHRLVADAFGDNGIRDNDTVRQTRLGRAGDPKRLSQQRNTIRHRRAS
jgi:hypothetical protein